MPKRFRVNKAKSARSFRHKSGKVHRKNMLMPSRGGFRL